MLLPCFVREWLWFDVGFKRYTTHGTMHLLRLGSWFDVGFKRYTTLVLLVVLFGCCGLM